MHPSLSLISLFRIFPPDDNINRRKLSTLGLEKYLKCFKKLNDQEILEAESIRFSV